MTHSAWGSLSLKWKGVPEDLSEGKVQPVHKADNLTAICELTVYTMWDPQHLACYRDSFALLLHCDLTCKLCSKQIAVVCVC
jgi:hypothetical protein